MIVISSLGKRFGPQALFEGVSLQLNPGNRYGLVGANGSGKTTLLKILAGEEGATDGTVTVPNGLRLGVLRQDQFADDARRILDVAMSGDREVHEALRELDGLHAAADVDPQRVAQLTDLVTVHDGFTLEPRARAMLVGLGIKPETIDRPLGTLSGGFKLRVLLAQVLLGRPDVMLLDEPTNHLDILSIRWLEVFLQNYGGCAVIISHDRRFLDAVATRILDVDYQTVTDYPGNYSRFLEQKQTIRAQKEVEIARAEEKIAQKKAFVERFRAKATKARQAQSRLKQIEKIEVEELAPSSRRAPKFRFTLAQPTGKDVLAVEDVAKSYGENRVLSGVEFQIQRGERVAIIGANGIGKSTLLKIVTGNLHADHGHHEWGHNVKVGYFAQDHREVFGNPRLTPLQFVWDICPQETMSYVRGVLGRMLLSGDDVDKPTTALSGGEAARLVFARIMVEQPNVLVLDEPTNHLDLESIEALTEALRDYAGTLVFVSHDRHLVGELATRVIELKADGLHDFRGAYQEYIARDGDDHLNVEAVVLKAKSDKQAEKRAARDGKTQLGWEERKRLQNRRKTLPKRRDQLLASIEEAEKEKAALVERMGEPGFYVSAAAGEIKRIDARQSELDRTIEKAMAEWEAVEAELAELEAMDV